MMSKVKDGTRRSVRFAWLAVAVAAVALSAQPARAADECISKKALDTLATCPGGKLQANITNRPQHTYASAVEEFKLQKKDLSKPVNPTDIAKTAQRDERAVRMKARSRQLLVTEIANVERLYKSTPKKSKDRPQLMRRLAEGYVELESAAFRDKVEAEVKSQNLKKKNPKGASAALQDAKKAEAVLKIARKNAIEYYTRLKDQYPKWCQFPQEKEGYKGCTDEVLYYLAYEYEQSKDLEKARSVYLELIDGWKNSRFIPNAFLAFGELFFAEAQGDPTKWGLAEQAYSNVIKYPPPENKLFGYARYKLGYVYWNKGEFDKAIDEFKRVIEFGTTYTQLPGASGLADSARKDIIPVYALKGNPGRAYEFFKPLSGDSGSSNDKTFKMMESLGTVLLDTGHYEEAIILYRDLIKRNPGDHTCQYQAAISKCTMAKVGGADKPVVVQTLKDQLATHKGFSKESHSPSSKLECANESAGLMTETAMAWHLEAVGSGGVRGTGDLRTMAASEELYELVVNNFSADEFKQFKFPRIVKEDWPTIPKIRYAMADLLFFQKKWDKCGPAFDAVVALDPTGPDAPEAAFASVLCYQNIYAERHKDGSHRKGGGNLPKEARGKKDPKKEEAAKYASKDFTDEQKGMLTAFNRYICYIKPPDKDRDALEQYVEVKYARGRTYFEAQHWEEAAAAFRDVGMNHSDMGAGIYAAQLYLEALNVIGSKLDSPRPSCYDDMEKDVPKFIELYCTNPKKASENADQCGVLAGIQRDIERLKAEEWIKKCDKDAEQGRTDVKCYEKGATLYLNLWKKYGEEPCKAKKPECQRNEEILYNAARGFQAAHLIAKAISVRKILIDEQYNLHKTELARKAVYEIGGNYQAIAVYDLAADWYEKFAKENETMEKASTALSDSVVLRLGLGQLDKAIADADAFNRKYGAKQAAEAAQIAFAIGAYYAEKQDWRNADRRLSGAMRQIEQKANFDVQLQAWATLARTNKALKSGTKADQYYGKVRDAWRDPAAARTKIVALGGSQDQQLKRLAKSLTAVGEALYHFAEKERVAVDAIKFPEYKGKGERKEVEKHIQTKVKDWMEKKEPAIKKAEAAYLKIVELQPSPPPRWVIAAGAAVGGMWGRYVAEFRAAPYPREWDQKGNSPFGDPNDPSAPPLSWAEIRAQYLASLDGASEKQKKQARAAYETCLNYSVKYQYFDEDSRSCEKWLSKSYPNDFHLIDEFRGTPSRVNSGLDERAQPLATDGTPVQIDTRQKDADAEKAEAKKDAKK